MNTIGSAVLGEAEMGKYPKTLLLLGCPQFQHCRSTGFKSPRVCHEPNRLPCSPSDRLLFSVVTILAAYQDSRDHIKVPFAPSLYVPNVATLDRLGPCHISCALAVNLYQHFCMTLVPSARRWIQLVVLGQLQPSFYRFIPAGEIRFGIHSRLPNGRYTRLQTFVSGLSEHPRMHRNAKRAPCWIDLSDYRALVVRNY